MANWVPLKCEATKDLVYKFDKVSNGYKLSVTDGVHLFSESLKNYEVEDHCSELNPAIDEAPASDLIDEISEMLCDSSTHIELQRKENALKVTLNGKLFGYDFQWVFEPKKESPHSFFDNVSKDLLNVVNYMFERERTLVRLLRNKDLEISDYQGSGATLTRKSLKTDPFSEDDLTKVALPPLATPIDLLTSADFKATSEVIKRQRNSVVSTPTSTRKDRKKRIRIKGMKVSDMLKSDDEDDSEEDEPPKKVRPSPTVSPVKQPSAQTQAKQLLKKKLKKL